jgi:hypothetical protein
MIVAPQLQCALALEVPANAYNIGADRLDSMAFQALNFAEHRAVPFPKIRGASQCREGTP